MPSRATFDANFDRRAFEEQFIVIKACIFLKENIRTLNCEAV